MISRPILHMAFRRRLSSVFFIAWLFGVSFAVAPAAPGETRPFVSPMFGDNMVLQRGKPNPIWGWANAGAEIRVTVDGKTVRTVTADDGRWMVAIDPPAPGGPYRIAVDGPRHVEFREVLVGDVWLCGGQSNMEMGLTMARNGADEIKAAAHPEIRLFAVGNHVSYHPVAVPEGAWTVCSPDTVAKGHWGGFSAVAYFFGRRLQQEVHVPIGLIQDCVGGTPAESWTSASALPALGDFDAQLAEVRRLDAAGGPQYGNYIAHWYDEYDPGQKDHGWFGADLDDRDWKTVPVPGGFRELGVPDTPAVCYFRRSIILPAPLPAGDAHIELGVIERMDTVMINGRMVGASSWVENPRVYPIAPGVLQPGRNNLAIRVLKTKADGGFRSPPAQLRLVLGDGTVIPLAGEWKGKLAVDARPPHPLPLGYENWPVMPSVLYNGMIAPVAPLAITGAIWYQGEQNAAHAGQYRRLLPAMIADWRHAFGQGDFPFYIVSLAAFMHRRDEAGGPDDWAELRDAQAFAARTVPNSGLAVAIDVGDADNIHPKDKQPVGERLAALALAGHYGFKIPSSGPQLASTEPIPGALCLHFSHADGGLIAKGGAPGEFSVCGRDGRWHWATAVIAGDTVIVRAPEVPEPVFVRYAWQSNPKAALYNGAGFPAVPFRTDQ